MFVKKIMIVILTLLFSTCLWANRVGNGGSGDEASMAAAQEIVLDKVRKIRLLLKSTLIS